MPTECRTAHACRDHDSSSLLDNAFVPAPRHLKNALCKASCIYGAHDCLPAYIIAAPPSPMPSSYRSAHRGAQPTHASLRRMFLPRCLCGSSRSAAATGETRLRKQILRTSAPNHPTAPSASPPSAPSYPDLKMAVNCLSACPSLRHLKPPCVAVPYPRQNQTQNTHPRKRRLVPPLPSPMPRSKALVTHQRCQPAAPSLLHSRQCEHLPTSTQYDQTSSQALTAAVPSRLIPSHPAPVRPVPPPAPYRFWVGNGAPCD